MGGVPKTQLLEIMENQMETTINVGFMLELYIMEKKMETTI